MRTILSLSLLLLACLSTLAQTTNISIAITVVTPAATNTTSGTLNYTNTNDVNLINGVVWMYDKARVGGYTNRFDRYIGQVRILDDFKAMADAYNADKYQETLRKLTQLLTTDISLLSPADLVQLSTIAAKLP